MTTSVWARSGTLSRIAATSWLLLLWLPPTMAAQVIDRRTADSLSVQDILEIAARDSVLARRADAAALAAELIRTDSIGGPRTDSLVRGLRDLAITRFDGAMHAVFITALLASGHAHGQHALLGEVFDSARNTTARIALLKGAHQLPDSIRKELILRAVQLHGSPSATFVANLAAMMALQWDPDGRALLWEALRTGFIRDERTAQLVRAGLEGSNIGRGGKVSETGRE